jgi:hypothetical protein
VTVGRHAGDSDTKARTAVTACSCRGGIHCCMDRLTVTVAADSDRDNGGVIGQRCLVTRVLARSRRAACQAESP